MNEKIMMYGTAVCPSVPPVRGMLKRADAAFEYVDISKNKDAQALVKKINHGNASVPTLAFADGSTLTEPSLDQLKTKLATLGYQPSAPSVSDIFKENSMKVMPALFLIAVGVVNQELVWGVAGMALLGVIWWNGR